MATHPLTILWRCSAFWNRSSWLYGVLPSLPRVNTAVAIRIV